MRRLLDAPTRVAVVMVTLVLRLLAHLFIQLQKMSRRDVTMRCECVTSGIAISDDDHNGKSRSSTQAAECY